jgi:hypothetical protein
LYSADHERLSEKVTGEEDRHKRVYLNSATYLKVGQSLWVDRIFANAVVSGMYNFHASASAYMEYWNNSFGHLGSEQSFTITRRQVWQAFVQESVRTVATVAGLNLELRDGLDINEMVKEAYNILGENGLIRTAHQHSCLECTQEYKATSDIVNGADPAAVVGVDENRTVPPLQNSDLETTTLDIATSENSQINSGNTEAAPVKMIVMDGIVMGPQHCAFDGCIASLSNARGGAFCAAHEIEYGTKCRVHDCQVQKISGIQTCHQHKDEWARYQFNHLPAIRSGARRVLRHSGENVPWQPTNERTAQPHDEPAPDVPHRKNYFTAGTFYCVETICAPCGVVIAWTKFDRAESPTNILDWLESIYPTEESRPDYICIDKACVVLRTAITSGRWNQTWKNTTRFIVDSYHYINHRTDDYLCRTWCNPAPLDGSAPNLVVAAQNTSGQTFYKRAFNTQVWIVHYW